MVQAIIGKKIGMTQIFAEDGTVCPVTVIEVGPCVVTQIKTAATDGYDAIQIALGKPGSGKGTNKPMAGHLAAGGLNASRMIREMRGTSDAKVGDAVTVKNLEGVSFVDVIGISKGKGFQGVIKRYGFGGGRASHGSQFHRAPGSIGQSAWPSKVFKGQKMPGQMGNKVVTTKNLEIKRLDEENNLIMVRGAVPGSNNGLVFIRKAKTKG